MARGLFITGTDTNVGKTFVGAQLARWLRRLGVNVGVYKPAASGCQRIGDELVSDDALALWEAAGKPGRLADVCPQRFAAPLAPHLAARVEGQELDRQLLRDGLRVWTSRSDLVIVEGAGGFLSPLGDDEYVADLALDCGFPLLIVAANVLGTINLTLQTVYVARHYRGGQRVAGIVVNDARRDDGQDPSRLTNAREIQCRASVPFVVTLGHGEADFGSHIDWNAIFGEAIG